MVQVDVSVSVACSHARMLRLVPGTGTRRSTCTVYTRLSDVLSQV